MLWTIVAILLVLWLLRLVSSYTLGGLIPLVLGLALVILIINSVSGRRTALEPAHVAQRSGEVPADRRVDPFENKSMKFKENM
jgi:hypothetical protein